MDGTDVEREVRARNQDYHSQPKGLRDDPQNRVERHKAVQEKVENPGYEKLMDVAGTRTGKPVGDPDTVSGRKDPILAQPGGPTAHYVDKVVEGRLGGGEEVVYDASQSGQGLLSTQGPTPRSDQPVVPISGVAPDAVK
jgi:hypothetical protein